LYIKECCSEVTLSNGRRSLGASILGYWVVRLEERRNRVFRQCGSSLFVECPKWYVMSIISIQIQSTHSLIEVDAKTSYNTVLARRRANPQELEYTLAITTGFFLFMIVVPVIADSLGL
jgi:hypothetical protein